MSRKRQPKSWQRELDELAERRRQIEAMGGPEKVARQHAAGRLNVRERIDALLDEGSFRELGALAGAARYRDDGSLERLTPGNLLAGRGRIDGRDVVVSADDFTVRGGAADASIHAKQIAAEQFANEYRLPLVRLIEGSGGGGSVKSLETAGFTYVPMLPAWQYVVDNLATVPVVALALGPVAGLGAARLTSSHYSLMVKDTAQVFVAGPPVVAAAGEDITKEALGGSDIQTVNGNVDDAVASEAEAFDAARRFLSYLPSSVYDVAGRIENGDDPNRRDKRLISAIPRDRRAVYKMQPILESIVDRGSLFEIARRYGASVITALARLDGWPVAILASNPFVMGGLWTAASADKVRRFVDLAQTFHLPVVHFVDCPGFVIGSQAERDATIRQGVRALAAIYQATVPWCSVIVRKAFGVAGAGHGNAERARYRYAWPSGDWGSLPIEGGIEAAYRAELDAADDRSSELQRITERLNRLRSPFRSAEKFAIEDIIDPRDTRPLLCEFAGLAAPLRQAGPTAFGLRP